ncbi:MAG TPA: hypothetical protein VHP31_11855 [Caproicibacter sp.]|nr:hypothetical protein [Caproicibacter sp.]
MKEENAFMDGFHFAAEMNSTNLPKKPGMTIIQQIREALAAGENADILHTLLPELLKAADEGKIVELPCKVGDTIYCLEWDCCVGKTKCNACNIKHCDVHRTIHEVKVSCLLFLLYEYCSGCFGKTDFTSRKAAEKALGERDGG